MNRLFTADDNGKPFRALQSKLVTRGVLEFPITDVDPGTDPALGLLWGKNRNGGSTFTYVLPHEVEPLPTAKGLPVNVFRDNLGDCTNGGVTATATRALLIGPEIDALGGNVFEARPEDAVLVIERWKGAYRAVPWLPEDTPRPWFMFGGNFVYTSDSRMPRAGLNGYSLPIPVHDRVER